MRLVPVICPHPKGKFTVHKGEKKVITPITLQSRWPRPHLRVSDERLFPARVGMSQVAVVMPSGKPSTSNHNQCNRYQPADPDRALHTEDSRKTCVVQPSCDASYGKWNFTILAVTWRLGNPLIALFTRAWIYPSLRIRTGRQRRSARTC